MRRKKGNTANGRSLLLCILVVAVVSVAALGYLWQQTEIHGLGREMKALELELEELRQTNERLSRSYAEMCTPRALEQRVRQMGLELTAPQPGQMIRMTEPLEEAKAWAAGEPRDRSN